MLILHDSGESGYAQYAQPIPCFFHQAWEKIIPKNEYKEYY